METGKLYMRYGENGIPRIVFEPVNGTVFLTVNEIANLLGCFVGKVTSNIKVILKLEVLRESEVMYCQRYANGGSVDLYSLDVIIALSYRINSYNSEIFRKWLTKRICRQEQRQGIFESSGFCWN